MIEANSENYPTEIADTSNLVVVYFSAPWCAPCKAVQPAIEELEADELKQARVKFLKLDVEEMPAIAMKYSVRSLPTLMAFSGGELKDTLFAPMNKESIKSFVQDKL